jgi:hypothetical protein
MGTIVNTVGSAVGRDYATLADWWSAIPSDLVTDGNSYIADLYNDSEFLLSATVELTGKTTDATHTITIEAADGQGWNQNGSVITVYNPANGVAFSCSTPITSFMFTCFTNYVTIQDIQFKCDQGGALFFGNDGQNSNISGCLIETTTDSASGPPLVYLERDSSLLSGSALFINNVIISRNSLNAIRIDDTSGYTDSLYYNTFVCSTNGAAYGLIIEPWNGGGGVINLANNAIFGFTNTAVSQTGTVTLNANNNATDLSSIPGSNSLTDLTFADQFVNIDDSVRDFRISTVSLSNTITVTIYASALVGAGTSAGSIGADVFGITRPTVVYSNYDIGATEIS